MTPKVWFAVDVTVWPNATDAVEEAMADLADLGTSLDTLKRSESESVVITGFFSEPPDLAEVRRDFDTALGIHEISSDTIHHIELRTVEDADWLAEWKRHWRPTEVGRFVISPPWLAPAPGDKLLISIEPNMAFGTGTHETTRLCLEAISELYTPDQTVLDVGTGTGILAIAAAKLGGSQIIACDTDADSVKIARENAVLNGVADKIEFFHGSIDDASRSADLVCANLTIDVIVPILPLLIQKTRRNLLLSGILAEQQPIITAELAKSQISDFRSGIRREGEWISVIVSFQAS